MKGDEARADLEPTAAQPHPPCGEITERLRVKLGVHLKERLKSLFWLC